MGLFFNYSTQPICNKKKWKILSSPGREIAKRRQYCRCDRFRHYHDYQQFYKLVYQDHCRTEF